jgi:hypothetical protein
VIPTAIIAGFIFGLWLRWWAVPIVAVGWTIVIAIGAPSVWLGAMALGALNGAVGVVLALLLRRAIDGSMRPRRNQPSHRH